MRSLVAEDDVVSNKLLKKFLSKYGECISTEDGQQCVEAYIKAIDEGQQFDLICLDIMMPNMDGIEALEKIRAYEYSKGIGGRDMVKIIMTTAVDEVKSVMGSFRKGCESYLIKPVDHEKIEAELMKLGLVKKDHQI